MAATDFQEKFLEKEKTISSTERTKIKWNVRIGGTEG